MLFYTCFIIKLALVVGSVVMFL